MEQDPNKMPIHTAEQGIEEEGFEEPTGRGEPIEEEVFVDAHGTTNTATDSSQHVLAGLLNDPVLAVKTKKLESMFMVGKEGSNSTPDIEITPSSFTSSRKQKKVPDQSGTRMEEEEEVKDQLLKNLPSKSGSKRPPRSFTGDEYAKRKKRNIGGDGDGVDGDQQHHHQQHPPPPNEDNDADDYEDDEEGDDPRATFNSQVEIGQLRKAQEEEKKNDGDEDNKAKKKDLEEDFDQVEKERANRIREKLEKHNGSGLMMRKKKVVKNKKYIEDTILKAVEAFMPAEQHDPAAGGGALNEALRSRAKEILKLSESNPDTEIHAYGRGIKFLKQPKIYDRASIKTFWELVKTQCSSSLHNTFLNLMSFTFQYLMSIDKDLKKKLCEDLAKKDMDIMIFANYLFEHHSTKFHVSSLPGDKYNGDSRFNLLRLCELKYDFARIILSYLQKFFSMRRYSSRIHWNSQSGGGSFISSNISPSFVKRDDDEPLSMFRKNTSNFNLFAVKSDNANRLNETNFQHKPLQAQKHRELFYCNPRTNTWFAQKLQALDETPYFPQQDKTECLYFTPLRFLIEKMDYELPPSQKLQLLQQQQQQQEEGNNNNNPPNLPPPKKILIPPWNILFREGICNVAGEHTVDGKKDFSLNYYQGAFDLAGKFPEMYQDVITNEINPETNVVTATNVPPTNSFFLQEINLNWTAILSSDDNKGIYPETTFRFLNRKKERTEFLCQCDSRRRPTTAAEQQHQSNEPFPRVESDYTLKLDDILLKKEERIAKKVVDQGLADQGFVMLEPTLQVRGKGDTICGEIIEWIMNMSYQGFEGPVEAIQLYQITLYCMGVANRGLRLQKNKLRREGIQLNKDETTMMEEEEMEEEKQVLVGGGVSGDGGNGKRKGKGKGEMIINLEKAA